MVANSPQARKGKGRTFQKEIIREVMARFPELEPGDIESRSMGSAGIDLMLSPKAKTFFPYAVEAKFQEHLAFWQAIQQAESNGDKVLTPIVVFKRSRSKPYVIIDLQRFLELTRNDYNVWKN